MTVSRLSALGTISAIKSRAARYEMLPAHLEELIEMQSGRCAICEYQSTRQAILLSSSLVIDHCHQSGQVRGLLCNRCNSGLGFFKDQSRLLKRALEYLESNPVTEIHSGWRSQYRSAKQEEIESRIEEFTRLAGRV